MLVKPIFQVSISSESKQHFSDSTYVCMYVCMADLYCVMVQGKCVCFQTRIQIEAKCRAPSVVRMCLLRPSLGIVVRPLAWNGIQRSRPGLQLRPTRCRLYVAAVHGMAHFGSFIVGIARIVRCLNTFYVVQELLWNRMVLIMKLTPATILTTIDHPQRFWLGAV